MEGKSGDDMKVIFLLAGGLFFVLSLGCSEGFQIAPFSKQSIAGWGDYPATPDGTDIEKFEPVVGKTGGNVVGLAQSDTKIFTDGDRESQDAKKGSKLFVVAKVTTTGGNSYYIAQNLPDSASVSSRVEGYVDVADVFLTSEEMTVLINPEAPNPNPNPNSIGNGSSTCPTNLAFFQGSKQTHFIKGETWRSDPSQMSLAFDHETGWDAVRIMVTNHSDSPEVQANDEVIEETITLDATSTHSEIGFEEFVPQGSDWFSLKLTFQFELLKGTSSQSLRAAAPALPINPEAPPVNPGPNPTESTPANPGLNDDCSAEVSLSSPIVFHFSSDTFKTLPVFGSKTHFDHQGNGVKTKTGWITQGTALLAWDKDGNGLIDSGKELFGEWTVRPNGELAKNGYEALRDYVDQGNLCTSMITDSNPIFEKLVLWFDHNLDGSSQKNELKSLKELQITAIDTHYEELPLSQQGSLLENLVKYKSRFLSSQCPNGECKSYDVYFTKIESKIGLNSAPNH